MNIFLTNHALDIPLSLKLYAVTYLIVNRATKPTIFKAQLNLCRHRAMAKWLNGSCHSSDYFTRLCLEVCLSSGRMILMEISLILILNSLMF